MPFPWSTLPPTGPPAIAVGLLADEIERALRRNRQAEPGAVEATFEAAKETKGDERITYEGGRLEAHCPAKG